MEGWPLRTLGDLVTLQRGIDLPDVKRREGNVPIMGSFGITGRHAAAACKGPGVTVGRSGASIGTVAFIGEDYWPLNTCLYVKDFHGNSPLFAFYFLKTMDLAAHNSGSAQPSLNRNFVHPLPIRFPALPEQRAIAATLGALDDKIELNRRMNETLEAMARALFRDWFVDFGPTRAKMAGAPPYLSEDLWSLFPDRLDDDGKPEGWVVGNLGQIAQSKNRGVSPSDVHEDTPYIGLEHMPRGSIALADWEGAGKVTSNKSAFSVGDFLFGKLRPYFHKVGIAPVSGICSTDIVVVSSRTPAWHAFVIACISDEYFVAYTDKTATGTKMPRTSWPVMAKYKLAIPPEPLAQRFNLTIAPYLERIMVNIKESRTLAETRDLLLPRLMSGELRLAGVDPVLEEVL